MTALESAPTASASAAATDAPAREAEAVHHEIERPSDRVAVCIWQSPSASRSGSRPSAP